MIAPAYWPPEGVPSFVSHDDEVTWIPLCGKCGRGMEPLRNGNSMANWECVNFNAHGLSLALIWAEDWPDYEEDDEDECEATIDGHLTCNLPDGHDGTHMRTGSGHIDEEDET